MKLKLKLLKHQEEFVGFSDQHDYVLCGDEMGLGKTFTALAISAKKDLNTLIVAPAFLKANWKDEILKFLDITESEIAIDKVPKRNAKKVKYIITSYSRLGPKTEEFFKWAEHVIADEAHYLKNLSAKRTINFHFGIQYNTDTIKKLTLLTGTPIKNRVTEFYSPLRLLSYCPNNNNGKSISKFHSQYSFSKYFSNESVFNITVRGRSIEVRKFEGLNHKEELKSYLQFKYMRRLTSQVIVLPELLERYVSVDYKYDDASLKDFNFHATKIEDHVMRVKKGSAIAKAEYTVKYAKSVFEETENPVVIFSDHVDPVIYMNLSLDKSRMITGATPMETRHEIVKQFQAREIDYLIATIGSASTGITLTEASDLIFNDMSYIPSDNAQASKRIHRIGQEKTCRIHKITGSFIDKRIMTGLTSKEQEITAII